MSRVLALIGVLTSIAASVPGMVRADTVEPTPRVKSNVVLREQPKAGSRRIGALAAGERAEYLGSEGDWHRARLADGTRGWLSARWTAVVAAPEPPPTALPPPPAPAAPKPVPHDVSRFEVFTAKLAEIFLPAPPVEIRLREPEPGNDFYQHTDPRLVVSGVATTPGSDGTYDIVLALDGSTSTNEFAEADVDGDGVGEDDWNADDSIFVAEIEAGVRFVRALGRLPGNAEGRRIRVGALVFAGDEGFHLRPEDEDFEPTPKAILALARRDSELLVPLTSDYGAVVKALRSLETRTPRGMTNFAAGIGRGVIELKGLAEAGAESEQRPRSQKVINFLTDGTPSLPYDGPQAGLAAEEAARLAAHEGIRINVFNIGRNAVTRKTSRVAKKVAHWTAGNLVELENPGDIVSILRGTALSYVDRVKLVNRTTRRQSNYVGTGIDGSFFGEVVLQEGDNEIAVVARLYDGREESQTFQVFYRVGAPAEELAGRLLEIRAENEVLVEQIKERLARRMRQEQGRKELDVVPEAPTEP